MHCRLPVDVIMYITLAHKEVLSASYDTKDFLNVTMYFELVVEIAVV
jgi:hypothetical protein